MFGSHKRSIIYRCIFPSTYKSRYKTVIKQDVCHNVTNAVKDESISRTETLRYPKMYSHNKFGIPTSNDIGDMVRFV